jgi:hypothetical protein
LKNLNCSLSKTFGNSKCHQSTKICRKNAFPSILKNKFCKKNRTFATLLRNPLNVDWWEFWCTISPFDLSLQTAWIASLGIFYVRKI